MYVVYSWGIQTGRHIAYEGGDRTSARHEMNRLRGLLKGLLPDERIVEIGMEVDGNPEEWTDTTRPWCDHCGHIVPSAKRWMDTCTFLCVLHTQEMLEVV